MVWIDRVIIDAGDARDIKKIYKPHSFDNIVFNPPYRKIDSGRINPLPEKAIARHEISGSLSIFLRRPGMRSNPRAGCLPFIRRRDWWNWLVCFARIILNPKE